MSAKLVIQAKDNCQTCINNYFLKDNKCNSICPDKFYGDKKNNLCKPCNDVNCLKCRNSINCDSCDKNFYVYKNKTCYDKCPPKTYK